MDVLPLRSHQDRELWATTGWTDGCVHKHITFKVVLLQAIYTSFSFLSRRTAEQQY